MNNGNRNLTRLAGLFAIVCAALLVGCMDRPEPEETVETFTPRIIDNQDGTYTVQYYWNQPGYKDDAWGFRVSLEDARERRDRWIVVRDGDGGPVIIND